MFEGVRPVLAVPETYALFIALWYVVMLVLGIPKLPPIGHLVGAVTFVGAVGGALVATARLDGARRRRSLVTLALGFVANALVVSLWTMTTGASPKQLMKTTLVGKVLIALVGACLFVGVAVALVSTIKTAFDRQSVIG